jgi:hypothetical protein
MSEPLTAESWAMAHGLTDAEVVAARAAIERGDMVMFSPDVAERLLDTLDAARDRPGLDALLDVLRQETNDEDDAKVVAYFLQNGLVRAALAEAQQREGAG